MKWDRTNKSAMCKDMNFKVKNCFEVYEKNYSNFYKYLGLNPYESLYIILHMFLI